jgi:hypothetical protein
MTASHPPEIVSEEEAFQPEKLIVGYTTRKHLLLDLDKTHSLFATEHLIRMIQKEYPDVGDCLISESSLDGFHCIFNNKISWSRIMHIARILTGLHIVNRNFTKVRMFREDLTLRISSIDRGEEKSEAPKPMKIISPYKFTTIEEVNAFELYGNRRSNYFSGICVYLEALSAFRKIELIPIL